MVLKRKRETRTGYKGEWIMKPLSCSNQSWLTYACATAVDLSHTSQDQASEELAIDISAQFLTPGYHHLSCPSLQEGRENITKMLSSVKWYSNAAFISAEDGIEQNAATDLYYVMLRGGWLTSYATVTDFFAHQFEYDFVWIELNSELLKAPWFVLIENALCDFHVASSTPIFIISREKMSSHKQRMHKRPGIQRAL
jgi:hypothetical protein